MTLAERKGLISKRFLSLFLVTKSHNLNLEEMHVLADAAVGTRVNAKAPYGDVLGRAAYTCI